LTGLKTITKTALGLGKEATASIEELGRSAGKRLDEARDETGSALHTAACSVRTAGRQGSEAIKGLATGAANRLDATASYVEEHDAGDVCAGLRRLACRHLTASLAAAAGIGFLAGSALGRATQARPKSSPEGA
jgi:hypothetical protein